MKDDTAMFAWEARYVERDRDDPVAAFKEASAASATISDAVAGTLWRRLTYALNQN
jgi:hypothetical protein